MSNIYDFDNNQISWKFAERWSFVLVLHCKNSFCTRQSTWFEQLFLDDPILLYSLYHYQLTSKTLLMSFTASANSLFHSGSTVCQKKRWNITQWVEYWAISSLSLIHSHRSLIRLPRTARFAQQGGLSHLLFKESIFLSFCAEYSYCENCSEKVFYCSFCMQELRGSKWFFSL